MMLDMSECPGVNSSAGKDVIPDRKAETLHSGIVGLSQSHQKKPVK